MRRVIWVGMLLGLVAGVAAAQQQDFSKVEIKVTKVSGSVYMLVGAGGNIGVSVGDDGIVVVDDQFAPLADKIQAALKGITDKPVRFVINTHWHGDHTGGNEAFGKLGTLIAQENVRKRLESGGKVLGNDIKPAPKGALPIITFDHDVTIHLNGEDVKALHFPSGHTDGDSVIYFTQSNVVHMGDDFFSGSFPFIDLDSGGSIKGMILAVDAVVAQSKADTKFIPGHGPLSTIDDLRAYASMLRDCEGIVEDGIRHGKTLDQLKQEKVLAKYDKWGKGFITTDRFLETIFHDLSGDKGKMGFVTHN